MIASRSLRGRRIVAARDLRSGPEVPAWPARRPTAVAGASSLIASTRAASSSSLPRALARLHQLDRRRTQLAAGLHARGRSRRLPSPVPLAGVVFAASSAGAGNDGVNSPSSRQTG